MIGADTNAMVIQLEWMQSTGSADFDEMREATASMIKALANLQVKMGGMTHADRRELLKTVDKLCPKKQLSEGERRHLKRDFKRNGPASRLKGGRS
ncbi:MAG: hypothetical protein KA748_02635 [Halomonas sp.]|nr:hypothetical protein [Halomonas sp.]MBP5979079.1 hypothetical protein [Halomonas sp.]